jgi:hypothetical protein
VRRSVADVNRRFLIVGPPRRTQREGSHCPMPSGRSYLISRIQSRPRLLSSPAAAAFTAAMATGAVTSGTRPAKPRASVRGHMIFGQRTRRS